MLCEITQEQMTIIMNALRVYGRMLVETDNKGENANLLKNTFDIVKVLQSNKLRENQKLLKQEIRAQRKKMQKELR
jgi:hypothetical protein